MSPVYYGVARVVMAARKHILSYIDQDVWMCDARHQPPPPLAYAPPVCHSAINELF